MNDRILPPARMLSPDQAARYCGVSVPTFEDWCPVIPIKVKNRKLYDRNRLDAWLDSLSPGTATMQNEDWLKRLDSADAA